MEAGRFVIVECCLITRSEGRNPFFGEHCHANKFAMRLVVRELLADSCNSMFPLGDHKPGQVTPAGWTGQGDEIGVWMQRLGVALLLVMPGEIDDHGDIRWTLQQLF